MYASSVFLLCLPMWVVFIFVPPKITFSSSFWSKINLVSKPSKQTSDESFFLFFKKKSKLKTTFGKNPHFVIFEIIIFLALSFSTCILFLLALPNFLKNFNKARVEPMTTSLAAHCSVATVPSAILYDKNVHLR